MRQAGSKKIQIQIQIQRERWEQETQCIQEEAVPPLCQRLMACSKHISIHHILTYSHTNIFTYTNNIFIHTQITYSFIRKYTNDVSLILQHILTYTHKYTSAFSIDQLATFVLQKIFCIFFLGEIELSQIKFT